MFIPKHDRLRHKILELLIVNATNDPQQTKTAEQSALTIKSIANILKTEEYQIIQAASKLQTNSEVVADDFGKGQCLYAWTNSGAAYADKKYLKEGRSFVLGRMKDYLSIAVAIAAIFGAVRAIIISKKNESQIQTLQKRLDKVEKLNQPQVQPK